jgi:hypothetical protein
MSAFPSTSIEVNFNVEVNAEGSIEILSEAAPTVSNVVVADVKLPVDALYDGAASKGLIEFWEDADVEDIVCQLAKTAETNTDGYEVTAKKLVLGLQNVLKGTLDAKNSASVNAPPFADYANASDTKMVGFGRLALMAYSHYILGHVQATAAITNDVEFIRAMESTDSNGNYKHTVGDYVATAAPYATAGTTADANLAARLVQAIVSENSGTSLVSNGGLSSVANIVKQVLGQDANRAVGEDNSKYSPEKHGLLKFFAGDVIYVNIKLATPTVAFGGGLRRDQRVDATTIEGRYATQNSYTIKITLGNGLVGL